MPLTNNLSPIVAQDSRDLTVTYTPTVNGADVGKLAIASANTNALNVTLNGTGSGFTLTPIQEINNLIAYMDAHVIIGDLYGTGKGKEAAEHLKAFRNMLFAISDSAEDNHLKHVCDQLQDAVLRADGMRRPPDYVAGPAVKAVGGVLEQLIAIQNSYKCPIDHECDHDDDNDHHHDRH